MSPIAIKCPLCGVGLGQKCLNESGRETDYHDERVAVAIEYTQAISTSQGLLWRNGQVIPLPEADLVAMACGYSCAEQMVKALQKQNAPASH